MSLSSYFSDNKTKLKDYDQYYDHKSRSDFVQRQKLRALIAQEAADDAMTEKLAQLYMSSVSKLLITNTMQFWKKIRNQPLKWLLL